MAWSHSTGELAVVFSMSSWLSQGWPSPCQTCTKRTPRSIRRRAIRQLPGLRAGAVHVADVLRLLGDVEGVGGLGLHPEGQFEDWMRASSCGSCGALVEVPLVELPQQVELPGLAVVAVVSGLRMFSISVSSSVCSVSM